MARTKAIGLRRDPQPPMPIVLPSRRSATAASRVVLLSVILPPVVPCAARVGPSLLPAESRLLPFGCACERVAVLVRYSREVELERKALLHAVTGVHPLHVYQVQRLLRGADHPGGLDGDVAGHPQRRL